MSNKRCYIFITDTLLYFKVAEKFEEEREIYEMNYSLEI